jgi:acyl-CoA synthetase (NDP forming)
MTPLLAPRTIALVGGSPREGSVGNATIKALATGGFAGELNIGNPRYDDVEGFRSFPALADLPESPDLAVLSVAAHRMEQIMTEAIRAKWRLKILPNLHAPPRNIDARSHLPETTTAL